MITPDPYRRESYQEIMGLALAEANVETACKMIIALGNRGALDLLERDDQGCNVVERFCEHAPLGHRMMETIELMGGRGTWAMPHEGRFLAMELQEKWLLRGTNATSQHSTHRIGAKKTSETMAYMITHVDRQWLGLECDRGALAVANLTACGVDALDSVMACWARGADIHARLEDGTLAVANMTTIKSLNTWMAQGGNIHAPVSTHGNLPLWRHAAAHLQFSSHISLTNEIRKTLKDLVDPQELNDEVLFLDAWYERNNQAAMLSHLVGIPDWHQARRPDGTPVWLAALAARPDLVENFLTRKRARPDFAQRDHCGRSAWYAMMGAQSLDTIKLLESELPLHEYARDTQGCGLLKQVIEGGGGLVALGGPKPRLHTRAMNVLRLLDDADNRDRAAILDGINGAYLAGLESMPADTARIVAAKLFANRALLQAIEPEAAIAMGQRVIRGRLTDEKGSTLANGLVLDIIDNLKWAACTYGDGFPKQMREWLDGINSWDGPKDIYLCPLKKMAAPDIQAMVTAVVERAQMREHVDHATETPAKTRSMRL